MLPYNMPRFRSLDTLSASRLNVLRNQAVRDAMPTAGAGYNYYAGAYGTYFLNVTGGISTHGYSWPDNVPNYYGTGQDISKVFNGTSYFETVETACAVWSLNQDGIDTDYVYGSPQLADTGAAANDTRFFFDKAKGAFRAGQVTGNQWDAGNVGTFGSFAAGYNVIASGVAAFAAGSTNTASGVVSVAIGAIVSATNQYAFGIGESVTATGLRSAVIGFGGSTATGARSFAMGNNTHATAATTYAFGSAVTASAPTSMALGFSYNNNVANTACFGFGARDFVADVNRLTFNKYSVHNSYHARSTANPAGFGIQQDDYAIAAEVSFLTVNANVNMTGIVAKDEGTRITLINNGPNTVTLMHQNPASFAVNRFVNITGAGIALAPNGAREYIYDITAARWRDVG